MAFPDAAAVRRLAQRLAAVAGRRLDDARPWVDARLPDGTRLHAVLPPVAVGSTCLSLRVVRPRAFTLAELVAAGTVPPGGDRVLRALLRARLSFLISGGTGTGKTTLLSALLGLVGPDERIVLAEDSAELRPDHPHVVRLETRPANQEGAGLVTLQDLVRQALRMRPDRLVVGEVRGAEVVHLLAALNTGHEGGCGTVHANAAADVPARLEALGTAAGLDRAALHSQLAAALSVVLHLVRDRDGRRRIAEVQVLERDASGLVRTVPALRWGTDAFVRERGWGAAAGAAPRWRRVRAGPRRGRAVPPAWRQRGGVVSGMGETVMSAALVCAGAAAWLMGEWHSGARRAHLLLAGGRNGGQRPSGMAAVARGGAADPWAAARRVVGARRRAAARGARGVGAAGRRRGGRGAGAAAGTAGPDGAAGPRAAGRRGDRAVLRARR
ncbi:hypothetical protein GCM10020295_38200 [Streptomyces cinereospinus]